MSLRSYDYSQFANRRRPCSDIRSRYQVALLDLHQTAATKLVDREVEKCAAPHPACPIEEEADCPDLLCVRGRLVRTVFPLFQATWVGASYREYPVSVLLGL